MSQNANYSYAASVKSNLSDELINTYFIRPLAGIFVRSIFATSISPNQVTIASTLVGFVAALFYLDGAASQNLLAGLCITLKDILDSADGQLARAKHQYSRIGRFLDSIGDFFVNAFAFAAITFALFQSTHAFFTIALGFLAFVGTTLRVSYHVFYQTSFLHLQNSYKVNRVTEEIRTEDLHTDSLTLQLQKTFQLLYGWQDRLMMQIDKWCRGELIAEGNQRWYGDAAGLRLSGLMGLGTELFLLMIFSVMNRLELYLYVNVLLLNLLWLASVCYRKLVLRKRY